jgi:hypothetical protein
MEFHFPRTLIPIPLLRRGIYYLKSKALVIG